ncbi:MAG TPA: UDP-N-acetylmuramoyl-L-alanine--D-glutamate ligase [Solirubrobacteraceae bacterium]|nr:UDP-N-acetylmuramoyl-L-alanine--D-glutamate ligase [Solirubrobacteraceae bacterium]
MRFSELEGARVGVWGAGREIVSFARQLACRLPSARIVAAAFDAPPEQDARALLGAPEASIVTGAEVVPALRACDVVVRSPGVSVYKPQMRALRDAGVPVTTATSLWLAEHGGEGVIGVTGTKGKSTTAALAAHLARAAGRTVQLAGNIGVPALDLLDEPDAQLTVLELSSYHIADLRSGPQVALVTSLFREHTDWHGSEDAYRADKLRLLTLPEVRTAVINARDAGLAEALGGSGPRAGGDALVGAPRTVRYGVREGWDVLAEGVALEGEIVVRTDELALRGEHNALNLCGALAALRELGVVPELPAALRGFQPLSHRLQPVAERDGVLWVDDSISTTPESTLAALASFPGREIVLIAGGQDRGQDYARLAAALARGGSTLIGVPTTGERIVSAALDAGVREPRALRAADLREAVALAGSLAGAGGVVLLSPAAPSFDRYRDFEQRGERFRALVTGTAG